MPKKLEQKITRLIVVSNDELHCDNSCPMLTFSYRECLWNSKEKISLDLDRSNTQWKSLRHEKCLKSETNGDLK
jgi:hypothetical protein